MSAVWSKIRTNSCCAMSVTWRFTLTAWTLRWPPSLRTRTGKLDLSAFVSWTDWCILNHVSPSVFCRYCPECRNDASEVVLAGEKLKESKKKAKMASASSSSQRDWGKVWFAAAFNHEHLVFLCHNCLTQVFLTVCLFHRVWHVSAAPNSALSCRPTIMAPFLESRWEPSGSSECRWASFLNLQKRNCRLMMFKLFCTPSRYKQL